MHIPTGFAFTCFMNIKMPTKQSLTQGKALGTKSHFSFFQISEAKVPKALKTEILLPFPQYLSRGQTQTYRTKQLQTQICQKQKVKQTITLNGA